MRVGRLPRDYWPAVVALWEGVEIDRGTSVYAEIYYVHEDVLDHYLAYFEDDVVGTAQVNRDAGGRVELHRVVVAPDWREVGVGKALARRALEDYSGVIRSAKADTPLGEKLLESVGFEEERTEAAGGSELQSAVDG